MLSLWAAVNIGVWITRGPAEGGTWTISGNASVDGNTSMSYNFRTIRLGTYSKLRPDAFLEFADRVLGLVEGHYDLRSPLLIPGI